MAAERLSQLQRRILAWLVAEDHRLRGTMAAEDQALVRALVACGFDKGNVSTSLKGLERKGLIRMHRTPGGKAEGIDLLSGGRALAEVVNKDVTTTGRHLRVSMDDATCEALQEYAGRNLRTVETQIRIFVRQYVTRLAQSEGRSR